MIPKDRISKELEDTISSCKKGAENMTLMVSNILDYAKLRSKKLELDMHPINIKMLLHNIIDMHKVRAKQKNI